MKRLEAEGRADEALALARAEHRSSPGLVLGLAVARRLLDRGDPPAAAAALATVRPSSQAPVEEWALWREAAVMLQAAGKGDAALEWWRRLLALPALGAGLRRQWLPEAAGAARAAPAASG